MDLHFPFDAADVDGHFVRIPFRNEDRVLGIGFLGCSLEKASNE